MKHLRIRTVLGGALAASLLDRSFIARGFGAALSRDRDACLAWTARHGRCALERAPGHGAAVVQRAENRRVFNRCRACSAELARGIIHTRAR